MDFGSGISIWALAGATLVAALGIGIWQRFRVERAKRRSGDGGRFAGAGLANRPDAKSRPD